MYYCVDTFTGKRFSLGTTNRDAATQIVLARNQALRQPGLNLQIAKAYLAGSDSGVATRTWQHAMDAIVASKQGATQWRWRTAVRDAAFDAIRDTAMVERKLSPALARESNLERLKLDEMTFRWLLNEDAMATEKTAEGIRLFHADALKLERFVAGRL